MTNQKSPAHFWARFSGHGLLVMKSSVVDGSNPEKRAQKCAGFLSSLHCYFRSIRIKKDVPTENIC